MLTFGRSSTLKSNWDWNDFSLKQTKTFYMSLMFVLRCTRMVKTVKMSMLLCFTAMIDLLLLCRREDCQAFRNKNMATQSGTRPPRFGFCGYVSGQCEGCKKINGSFFASGSTTGVWEGLGGAPKFQFWPSKGKSLGTPALKHLWIWTYGSWFTVNNCIHTFLSLLRKHII